MSRKTNDEGGRAHSGLATFVIRTFGFPPSFVLRDSAPRARPLSPKYRGRGCELAPVGAAFILPGTVMGMPRFNRRACRAVAWSALLFAGSAVFAGCVERELVIDSEPRG